MNAKSISEVVIQHVEEASHLRRVRSILTRAPHVLQMQLARIDDRIAAHLDGVSVAGDFGVRLVSEALERPEAGSVFVATVCALEDRNQGRLDALLAIAETIVWCRSGFISAFGWVSATQLRGISASLLASLEPWRRQVGLAACAIHGVDPGSLLASAIHDVDADLRSRALRVGGRLGRADILQACIAMLFDAHPQCAFEAARSAVLLGDRTESLNALESLTTPQCANGLHTLPALGLLLKVASPRRAQAVLAALAKDPALSRLLIRSIGIAGDPHYVPWLIDQMSDPKLARLAGESFSLITGLDLAHLDLDLHPPESVEPGPNEDPEDSNVAMDEDNSLPWPNSVKIGAWWQSNGARFSAGTRYFMGDIPTSASCFAVLKSGFQRQRIAAAEYLSLLTPGTPLFNVAAPAWRQKRLLSTPA